MIRPQNDPIETILASIHLPKWTASIKTISSEWQYSVNAQVASFVVVLEGSCCCEFTNQQEPECLNAGDHFLLLSGDEHQWSSLSRRDGVILLGTFDHSGEALFFGQPDMIRLNHSSGDDLEGSLLILETIRLFHQSQPASWESMLSRLLELVLFDTIAASLRLSFEAVSQSGQFSIVKALNDDVVGPVLASLVQTPSNPWTVNLMSSIADTSKSTFSERFRELVGLPPMQYLTKLRMQKASSLLTESEMDISSIATNVGYESLSSFSNAFKRWSGISPSTFRVTAARR